MMARHLLYGDQTASYCGLGTGSLMRALPTLPSNSDNQARTTVPTSKISPDFAPLLDTLGQVASDFSTQIRQQIRTQLGATLPDPIKR